MATVTPNKRGAKSRETVLDAAERVMAEHGYEAATLALIVEEAGIPVSSVYHYFGSKDGVLLAVMERGAQRFFETLPPLDERVGTPAEHLALSAAAVRYALEQHPDFLRLVVVMATQPPKKSAQLAQEVVERVRGEALKRLRAQAAIAFGINPRSKVADRLARFGLALIDGAFVAHQADPKVALADVFDLVPAALVAAHAELTR